MENQENKNGEKNNKQHSHHHKSQAGHHADHGCCSEGNNCCEESGEQCCGTGKGKCCEPIKDKCCGVVSCCSHGPKATKLILGLIVIAALFLIGFSCGARFGYNHNQGFERYGMMDKGSKGCPFVDDQRQGGCRGAALLNSPEINEQTPAPVLDAPQVPLE